MKKSITAALAALLFFLLPFPTAYADQAIGEICVYTDADGRSTALSSNEVCAWEIRCSDADQTAYRIVLQARSSLSNEKDIATRYTYRGRVRELDYTGTLLRAYNGELDPNADILLSYDRSADELTVLYDEGNGAILIPQDSLDVQTQYRFSHGVEYFSLVITGSSAATQPEEPHMAESGSGKWAKRTYVYKDSTRAAAWTAELSAAFRFDGRSARCTDAACDVTTESGLCRAVSKSVTVDGRTARAEITMAYRILGVTYRTETYLLELSCDENGNLS